MSWRDALKGLVGDIVGHVDEGALPTLIKSLLGTEGVDAMFAKLENAGYGTHIASWCDQAKENLPITADQVKAALDDEQIEELARAIGISAEAILAALAEKLPELAPLAGPHSDAGPKPP
jgi:uncharacterized protein YidB (DUF937 family)